MNKWLWIEVCVSCCVAFVGRHFLSEADPFWLGSGLIGAYTVGSIVGAIRKQAEVQSIVDDTASLVERVETYHKNRQGTVDAALAAIREAQELVKGKA